MKLSQQSQSVIESAIRKAVAKFTCGCEQTIVTDIHIQPNQNSGELFIFDDEDDELVNVTIDEWSAYESDDFYENAERVLRPILCRMKDGGDFDKLTILKPYSFVLVDEEKETVAELLLVDDDTLLVNDELLKGLDEELDSFLKELLEKANTDTLTDEQVAEIKAGKEKLTESAQKLFTKMYEQAGAAAGAQGAGPQPGANAGAGPAPEGFQGDDVVDGDYKEV